MNCSRDLLRIIKRIFINFSCLSNLITLSTLIVLKTLMTPTNELAVYITLPMIKSAMESKAMIKSKILIGLCAKRVNPYPKSLIMLSSKNIIVNIEI